jgi:hypothetical protein
MFIERLRLVVEEAEAVPWCYRLLAGHSDIEEPRLTFNPGFLAFEGKVRVPLAGLIPFRTEWSAAVEDPGIICVRLERASAFGWGGGSGFLRGLIMGQVESRLAGRPGLKMEKDRILVDPAPLLAGLPVAVRLHVAALTLEAGRVVLETD